MNIPKLRFKGFNDEWKEEKIGNIACFKRGPFGSALKKSLFSPNGKYVVYEQQNAIYKNSNTRYRIDEHLYKSLEKFSVKNNDILMSGAGTIGAMYQLKEPFNKGVINQALIRIRLNNSTDDKYFIQYFSCSLGLKILTGKNAGSALKNLIPIKELKNSIINIPLLPEQQKIGALFAKLDNLIDLQAKKLELLKQLKQGLLQKLFPQNNQTTPQLRFKGFNDKWESKALKSLIIKEWKGKAQVNNLDNGNVLYLDTNYLNNHDNAFYSNGVKDVDKEDILILWDGSNAGHVYFNVTGALGSTLKAYKINKTVGVPAFVYQKLMSCQKIITERFRTPNIPHVIKNFTDIFTIDIPCLEEQQKISSLLTNLDNLLTKAQEKITLFKQVKKYLLQRMFI